MATLLKTHELQINPNEGPENTPLDLVAGDSHQIDVELVDDDGDTIDLTDVSWTYYFQDSAGVSITKSGTGAISISIFSSDTLNLATGRGAHELIAVDADENRATIFQGEITLIKHYND